MQTIHTSTKKITRFNWLRWFLVPTLALTIAAVSIPNLLRSRIAANEASAVGSVRTLNTALVSYASQHPGEGYPQKLADLSPYVDANLASGLKSGYSFRYEPHADADGIVRSFRVEARPQSSETGQRRFSSNESGAIHYRASAAHAEKPLDGGSPQAPERRPAAPETRRMLRKASVSLIVGEPAGVAEMIRVMAARLDGYVESVRLSDEGAGVKQVSISIRIPAGRFDEARRQVRALGGRVKNEEDDARDVTGQYVDFESNLRNFHAEEAQYLEIMRRSGSIKDTLAVAERLADVRGRIERAQGQINMLAHQTETSLLEVTLATEAVAQPVDVHWHPRAEIKAAFSEAADDLATYANFMIAVIFRLPVFSLWTMTLLASALCAWRVLRWIRKVFAPTVPTLATNE